MFLASHSKLHFSLFCFKFTMFFGVRFHLPLDFLITEFNSYFFMLCKPMFQYLRFYFGFLSCFTRYFSEFIPNIFSASTSSCFTFWGFVVKGRAEVYYLVDKMLDLIYESARTLFLNSKCAEYCELLFRSS